MNEYTFLVFYDNMPDLGSHMPKKASSRKNAWVFIMADLIPHLDHVVEIKLIEEKQII